MRLSVKNLGKIEKAEIIVDGITAITGNNNTGKSTIGKVFFSFFNGFYGMNKKVVNAIESKLKDSYREVLEDEIDKNNQIEEVESNFRSSYSSVHRKTNRLFKELSVAEETSKDKGLDDLCQIFAAICIDNGISKEKADDLAQELLKRRDVIEDIDENKIVREIITRYFKQNFNGQINSLDDTETDSEIKVEIKGETSQIVFNDNSCTKIKMNVNILHEAYYIDDPFVADASKSKCFFYPAQRNSSLIDIREHLEYKLTQQNDIMGNVVDAVTSKETLEEVYTILERVIKGQLREEKDDLEFVTEKYKKPIKVSNLSAGLKSFIIIKRLLEGGIIKEKDVIILDEPEIHLHPKWQLIYAELIVVLQEKFDLSVIITTNSVDFLEAIEYFSKKYHRQPICNYYMAKEIDDGKCTFVHVDDNMNELYQKMVEPGIRLNDLKSKWEEEND
ncbi:MAG: AAA family ATPase [Anaerostipes sp.]|nr:AAA family ATPase [Anaerostipes sp.]